MSQRQDAPSTVPEAGARGTSGWVGWIAFAGMLMIMLGTFHVVQGIVAVVKDEYFLVGSSGLVIDAGYTTWGWTHIVAGAVVALAGVGVFAGRMWARLVGTVVALTSALLNLAFLAAYPIMATLMIALAIVIIMALTVHGAEITAGD